MSLSQAQIAKRQATEKTIVRRAVKALLEAGWHLRVDNGGDDYETPWTTDFNTIDRALYACDEEVVHAQKQPMRSGWIKFVYGNDGDDVISDYTRSIGAEIDPIIDDISEGKYE